MQVVHRLPRRSERVEPRSRGSLAERYASALSNQRHGLNPQVNACTRNGNPNRPSVRETLEETPALRRRQVTGTLLSRYTEPRCGSCAKCGRSSNLGANGYSSQYMNCYSSTQPTVFASPLVCARSQRTRAQRRGLSSLKAGLLP